MAKKKDLTPEEQLQQAIVPKEEQPYPLSEGWRWVRLESICEVIMGQSPNGVETTDDSSYMPLIGGAADMGELYLQPHQYTKKPTKISKADDLILCIRATLGHPNFADGEYCLGRGVAAIRSNLCSKEFLRYMFLNFEQYLYDNATGSTFLSIGSSVLKSMPVPFPPQTEQIQIVEKINSYYQRLDEASKLIQHVLNLSEQRKAAILHKAFTGELTAKWRQERQITLNSWKDKKISEVCDIVRGGSPRPAGSPEFYGGNIPFMKVADITRNASPFVTATESFIKEAGLKRTRVVEENTLLLTNSGATLGVPAICTFKTAFNDGIAAFLGLNPKSIKFYYYFWSSKTNELRTINKGAAQPNLNTKIIGNIMHKVPTIEEQQEIVGILDNFFEKEKYIVNMTYCSLQDIKMLKKSILEKAFRGGLSI